MKVTLGLGLMALTGALVQGGGFHDHRPSYGQRRRDPGAENAIAAENAFGRAFEEAMDLAVQQQQARMAYGAGGQERQEAEQAFIADGAPVRYFEAR